MTPLTEENFEDHTRPFKLEEFVELMRQSHPSYPCDPLANDLTYVVAHLQHAGYRPVLHVGDRTRAVRSGLPNGYYFEYRPELQRINRRELEKLLTPEEKQRRAQVTRWQRNYRRRLRRIEQRERQQRRAAPRG